VEAAVVEVMRRTSQPAPMPSEPTASAPEPAPDKQIDTDDPLAKTTEARSVAIESPITQVSDTDDAVATGEHPIVDEITIVRPLRIISIGSDPPPPITSAVEEWPPTKPYAAPAPPVTAAPAQAERKDVPSEKKTDLLPPPVIPEDGWTPAPPEVAAKALAQPELPRFEEPSARPDERAPGDAEDASIDASEISAEESDLLEEIEPDAAPIPVKKPPPPPKADARARGAEAPAAEAKKPKAWFEEVFAEDYIRTMDVLAPEHVKKEVDFIEESLGVEHEGVILDLACGRGEHAIELASRGYNVMGVDLSPIALGMAHENLRKAKSAAGGAPQRGKPSFLRSDMRELDFEENFDGAYCWSTSFGYFDDETNMLVLKRLYRALRQGGMLLIDVINRDFVAPRSPSLVWFEGDRCVCMDDMYVDFLTSRLRVKRTAMFEDGHSRELEYSIRLYSLDTLGRLLHEVGFRVVEVTGLIAHPGIFFGTESPRLIVLAERA
jgi:SAM-dependent methyltransferase